MSVLFHSGNFTLSSGRRSGFKIDCDGLDDSDWSALARLLVSILPQFGGVVGVPRGGLKLAEALWPYITQGDLLIVDDVLTTGRSMDDLRQAMTRPSFGAVVFARGKCPDWITPLFTLHPALAGA